MRDNRITLAILYARGDRKFSDYKTRRVLPYFIYHVAQLALFCAFIDLKE